MTQTTVAIRMQHALGLPSAFLHAAPQRSSSTVLQPPQRFYAHVPSRALQQPQQKASFIAPKPPLTMSGQ